MVYFLMVAMWLVMRARYGVLYVDTTAFATAAVALIGVPLIRDVKVGYLSQRGIYWARLIVYATLNIDTHFGEGCWLC